MKILSLLIWLELFDQLSVITISLFSLDMKLAFEQYSFQINQIYLRIYLYIMQYYVKYALIRIQKFLFSKKE